MTNFLKIATAIAILMVGILVGILIGKSFCGCGETPDIAQIKKESEQKIKAYNDSILIYENKIAFLKKNSEQLNEYLDSLNNDYYKLRQKPISLIKTDSLTTELNRKGRETFGNAGNNSQISTALVFGNQFADNIVVLKKQLDNQKAQVTAQQGIIVHKDTIIQVQEITINQIIKTTKRQKNRARLQGILAGGIIVGVLALIL